MKKYKKFFEDDLWLKAFELQKEVVELSVRFPDYEKYGLRSQINNSSNSVMANIAEEHGRYHYADKIRVLYIVRGEIEETQSHCLCAVSRGYIERSEIVGLINGYENLKKTLNGRIKKFRNNKEKE
ncbi:MAG TPA: four helix bundle protein [Candidatus Magasanikbacteria bacterium]|nr:four helix bundle protein [Candidatus Magasanikbacteria bacterium]